MKITILIAEDHTLVRGGLKSLLDATSDLHVVAEAGDGEEAVEKTMKLKPAVVVMDIAMPRKNGIEATRQIHAAEPSIKVVILSMHGDRQYVYEALRAGASGYLLKDAASAELATAIKTVVSGSSYLSPKIAAVAMEDYVRRAGGESGSDDLEKLTARELEVVQAIAAGRSSLEIARDFHVSVHTVDTHRRNIMMKLEIHNVVGLVKWAIRHGLASLE